MERMGFRKVQALYDFTPTGEGQLAFTAGSIIYVTQEVRRVR